MIQSVMKWNTETAISLNMSTCRWRKEKRTSYRFKWINIKYINKTYWHNYSSNVLCWSCDSGKKTTSSFEVVNIYRFFKLYELTRNLKGSVMIKFSNLFLQSRISFFFSTDVAWRDMLSATIWLGKIGASGKIKRSTFWSAPERLCFNKNCSLR